MHQGAVAEHDPDAPALTDAVEALAAELRRHPLTVIALGPLTNVAALLSLYPELGSRMRRVVAVAGKRPGQIFRPGNSGLLHLHDLNFRKDPGAVQVVLDSRVDLVLLPYEAATKIKVGRADLVDLATNGEAGRWIAAASEGWIGFWEQWLGVDGFHPFDSLAVGYVAMPGLFSCEVIPARIEWKRSLFVRRHDLVVSHDFTDGPKVTYCFDVRQRLKVELMARLAGAG